MTYADSGVNYQLIDAFKRKAQSLGVLTEHSIQLSGASVVCDSRGESYFLTEHDGFYIARVVEGLGTFSVVADEVYSNEGVNYYDRVGYANASTIINDLICCGARPLTLNMFLAVGESEWFEQREKWESVLLGWREACEDSGCVSGAGETQVLHGVVKPGQFVIAGSGDGIILPKEKLILGEYQPKDKILFLGCSGLQTNGYTLARSVASELEDGYRTNVYEDKTFGELLLKKPIIYARFIQECLDHGIEIHAVIPITGHGFPKLLRPRGSYAVTIWNVPKPPLVYDFLKKITSLSLREMYSTFNMGVGLALGVPEKSVCEIQRIHSRGNFGKDFDLTLAGHVTESKKRVLKIQFRHHNEFFYDSSLNIR